MRISLLVSAVASLAILSGCTKDVDYNEQEVPPEERTKVVFNAGLSKLPIPSDLLFAGEPAGDGTMFAGTDDNPIIAGIDALDGASVLAPYDIVFDGSLDPNQTLDVADYIAVQGSVIPNPGQNVFLLPLSYPGGDPLVTAKVNGVGVERPTFVDAGTYQVAAITGNVAALTELAIPAARAEVISLDGGINNVIRITPLKPLLPKTQYLVALTDVYDSNGLKVLPSNSYANLRDEETDTSAFANSSLAGLIGVQAGIRGWEALTAGYFGFKRQIYANIDPTIPVPSAEDIIFSITFTTGGTDSVLKSIAAPETFIEDNLRKGYRQDAIAKLVDGTYNLQGDNSALVDPLDIAINSTLNSLLTSPTIMAGPVEIPNGLYISLVANSIAFAGAEYSDFANGAFANLIQTAAAEAAIAIYDSGAFFPNIATQAQGSIAGLAGAGVDFGIPAARPTNFFRVDDAVDLNAALIAPAKVYQGEITLPQYQEQPVGGDGSVIRTSVWQANASIPGITPLSTKTTYRFPFPTKAGDATVPVTVVTPDEATLGALGATKPADGWPVVIFVHGINSDRSTGLPMANALAAACIGADQMSLSGAPCFATVMIDQPLHGVVPSGSILPAFESATDPDSTMVPNLPAGSPNMPSATLTERHYDYTVDLASNPVPMDYAADSGTSGGLFINLTNFENARDSLRQMVLDLLNLNASLDTMDVDADGTADDLDPAKVYFIGHSLGAVDGIPFVAINNDADVQASAFSSLPKIQAASFLATGGGLPRLLVNSQSFAPPILAGLSAASDVLVQGNSALESYFATFQGVLDSVDAMNFASKLTDGSSSTGVLLTEVVGDGDMTPADTVIPNGADTIWGANNGPLNLTTSDGFVVNGFPAPLAGTEPLIAQFGAIPSDQATSDGDPAVLVTRFTKGSHSTPFLAGNTAVDPYTSGEAFTELVSQIVAFFAVDGDVAASIVTDTSVVQ